MKAIVSISQTSQGECINLMGHGYTELAARVAAYSYVNHGRNDFEAEFEGGILISVSDRLAVLINENGWNDIYNESGEFVGSRANQLHMQLINAMRNLSIKDGVLDYKDIDAVSANTTLNVAMPTMHYQSSEIDYSEENY